MDYTTTRTSQDCPCGGRASNIPDVVRRHSETRKHMLWLWQMKCEEMSNAIDRQERRQIAPALHSISLSLSNSSTRFAK